MVPTHFKPEIPAQEDETCVFVGEALAEPAAFVHYEGQAHARLEAGATLLARPGDAVVTVVGLPDVLLQGSLLVLG